MKREKEKIMKNADLEDRALRGLGDRNLLQKYFDAVSGDDASRYAHCFHELLNGGDLCACCKTDICGEFQCLECRNMKLCTDIQKKEELD